MFIFTLIPISESKQKQSSMEELLLRFGHLGEDIFDSLDDKTLIDCSKVGKTWNSFIKDMKIFWVRIIKKHAKTSTKKHADRIQKWTNLFQKIKMEDVRNILKAANFSYLLFLSYSIIRRC